MFSRAFVPCRLRYYSTPTKNLKLWIKHNGSPSTQVSTKSCINLDDFADKVKQKLNTNSQVAIFTSLEKKALRPGLTIKDLLKTNEFKSNTDETPLLVKFIPATPDSIATKAIYIGETDEDGDFMGEYKRRILRNDHDLMKVIKPEAQGLIHLSSPDDVLLSFDDIKDGEKYQLYKFAQNFQSWQKKEADAMEAETLLSMKTFLMEKLLASSIDLPTDIYDSTGKQIQEWDGILLSGDTLYLLEAKHSMSIEKVMKIADRVKQFPLIMKLSAEKMFDVKDKKIVGIACGTRFPSGCREEAHRLGLMVVYPSGSRYRVDGKIDFDYIIQR
jgi:LysM repeat protein